MRKILVLEDSKDIAEICKEIFFDFDVTIAETIGEALKNINQDYDLMILDVRLPDGSGLGDFLLVLRNAGINTPVIVYSSILEEDDRRHVEESNDLGAVCFIAKPARLTTLRNAALAALGESGEELKIAEGDSFAFIQDAPDGTHKLVTLSGSSPVEFAVIRDSRKERTFCLPSQYGCREGCNFCVTGTMLNKHVRKLTCKELQSKLGLSLLYGGKFKGRTRIFFAGEGEFSRNIPNILKFMQDQKNEYEYRASTVGLIETLPLIIESFAKIPEFNQLQISLHAPNDFVRKQLMRSAFRNSISEILRLGEEFAQKSGKKVALNYVLFEGKNDSPKMIRELVELLKGRDCFFLRLSKANAYDEYLSVSDRETHLIAEEISYEGIEVKNFKSAGQGTSSPCGCAGALIAGGGRC